MKRIAIALLSFGILMASAVAVSAVAAPKLAVEDGRLAWSSVGGADGYNIYHNDQYLTTVTNGTSYTASSEGDYYVTSFDHDTNPTSYSGRSNTVRVETNAASSSPTQAGCADLVPADRILSFPDNGCHYQVQDAGNAAELCSSFDSSGRICGRQLAANHRHRVNVWSPDWSDSSHHFFTTSATSGVVLDDHLLAVQADGTGRTAMVNVTDDDKVRVVYVPAGGDVMVIQIEQDSGADAGWSLSEWAPDRQALNVDLPPSMHHAHFDPDWVELEPGQAVFHQDPNVPGQEVKFIHADGREAVYYPNGSLVRDPRYAGTFNYVNPRPAPTALTDIVGALEWAFYGLGHLIPDIAPWAVERFVLGGGPSEPCVSTSCPGQSSRGDQGDLDGDGTPNWQDMDPDGDGVTVFGDIDNDNDGVPTWDDPDDLDPAVPGSSTPGGGGDGSGEHLPGNEPQTTCCAPKPPGDHHP